MRSLALGALIAAGILLGLPDEAAAGGRSHGFAHSGGHFHPGFHSGVHTRIFIGAPLVVAPFAAYPYYYAPAPVYYAPPPPAYVEAPPPQQYWYYCASARAYYPYVQDCPGGWQRVLPTPSG
ncbi:MAG: hypothetical protein ACM30H_01770 [Clostridia bacterium]